MKASLPRFNYMYVCPSWKHGFCLTDQAKAKLQEQSRRGSLLMVLFCVGTKCHCVCMIVFWKAFLLL